MHQQTSLLFYKFRFVWAGLFAVGFIVLTSALVTTVGSHSVVDAQSSAASEAWDTSSADSPNVILNTMSGLVNGVQQATLSTGTALYSGCRSITNLTAGSGRTIVHGSAASLHSIGNMASASLHATGSGLGFVVRTPAKALGSVASGPTAAIIRPADDKPTPVISNETSTAVLASLSAQQQQEISSLQTGQLAANRDLGGVAVAGDPQHGGYPAAWDAPLPQDSRLDSWGMYNRECVSYTAWKVYQTYGHMPYWGGVGNANQWVSDARAAGIATGSTPQVHSVAISTSGYYGHAMWVEAVSGNMIYVSQYNYGLDGRYSEMWVNGSAFSYIYFH